MEKEESDNEKLEFLIIGLILLMTTIITNGQTKFAKDVHSYSNPEEILVKHVDLDWNVLFDQKMIKGSATLTVDNKADSNVLVLDTRDLTIEKVEISNDGKIFTGAQFKLGAVDKILGSSLTIGVEPKTKFVRVFYSTSPNASGLQWLSPQQTAGKKQPFMFSQAQAIHARSFIPLQDSPQVRVTYSAKVKTPKNLLAVMSAQGNSRGLTRKGEYRFVMPHPIPSYLIAIAVGDLKFQSLGKRTGVYTEPSMIKSRL